MSNKYPSRVAVIAGSTRPTRRSPAIARRVAEYVTRPDVELDVVDLAEVDLPMLCEPTAAVFGDYEQAADGLADLDRWGAALRRAEAGSAA